MRALQAILVDELAKEFNMIRHLFKLTYGTIASPLYKKWTDCDQDIYFDGAWWTAIGIKFDPIENSITGNVEEVSVTISNVDKIFSDLVLSEDIRGKSFNIYRVALDNNLAVLGYSTEVSLPTAFRGFIDSMEIDRQDAKIQVSNEFVRWQILTPRRICDPTCYKVFKGSDGDCGYIDGTIHPADDSWCDKSKSRCVTLLNTINFGGFEHISELADETFHWGQRSKTWGKTGL